MPDSLMSWYERELGFLRSEAAAFTDEHPQLARHLGVGYNSVSDPHVERLVESFALINARLSRQLAEDSTQISNNLLNIIFPLCLQSLPSTSMIQVSPTKDQSEVTTMPAGARFRAYLNDDQFCQFHTTRDMQLCPFTISRSCIDLRPFSLTNVDYPEKASALLRLDFTLLDKSRRFSDLSSFSEVTLHFQGLERHQAQIYDCLCRHRCHMVLIDDQNEQQIIPLENFSPVGFSDRDSMLTHENATFLDYQMMLELFAWPELFYGFRLSDFGDVLRRFTSHQVSLLIFLEDTSNDLISALDSIQFKLGCAPVINLFDQVAEPVIIDHRQVSYPVIPDIHSPNTMEIQSVKYILDVTGERSEVMPPMFGLRHNDSGLNKFWLYHPPETYTDVHCRLSVVCPELPMNKNQTLVLSPHLVCNNGMQVLDLPDNPRLECLDSIALPSVKMIMRPTARVRRKAGIKNRLNLLVHLKDVFTSVLQEDDPARSLRMLMSLYCLRNNAASTAWIDSMMLVRPKPMVATIRIDGHQCFTQGVELLVELDPVRLKQVSIMMFVNLIDFLAMGYADYHSFIEVVIRFKGEQGDYMRCTRRHGYQINR